MVLGWQVVEHRRVGETARELLRHRGRDITSTLGLVVRSQRRFGGIVSRERMESALSALIRPEEVSSVALLSAAGEVVAAAGAPIDVKPTGTFRPGEVWSGPAVTLMNLVDLGTNVMADLEGGPPPPPIIMPREAMLMAFETNRPSANRPPPNRPPRERPPRPDVTEATNGLPAVFPGDAQAAQTNAPSGPRGPRPGPGSGPGRGPFVRPNWMNPDEYQSLITKQGVHSFLIVISTAGMLTTTTQDLWGRALVVALATVAAAGMAFGWRNLVKASDLQIRLIKASEMNTHLKELNLAAAGLAHETRNPLNIIRGLAQLISHEPSAPPDIRQRSRAILDEADRVAAQLNEFINYSRPREIRRAPVAVGRVAAEVARALTVDAEEKCVQIIVPDEGIVVEADEPLFRQALFNLLLNAIQAVEAKGRIGVRVRRTNGEVEIDVLDNGPGVPLENRAEIFKPYFTTQKTGTGLGLAVVQQIVAAHGWSIACLANEPRGALFRVSHVKALNKA